MFCLIILIMSKKDLADIIVKKEKLSNGNPVVVTYNINEAIGLYLEESII